ncbi:MAG TPA: hypothetical protein VIY48_09155 [Candidatus Paceibacterota bacterium]
MSDDKDDLFDATLNAYKESTGSYPQSEEQIMEIKELVDNYEEPEKDS